MTETRALLMTTEPLVPGCPCGTWTCAECDECGVPAGRPCRSWCPAGGTLHDDD